jgi:hypothetical protein
MLHRPPPRALAFAILLSATAITGGCEIPPPDEGETNDACAFSSCPDDSTCRVVDNQSFCDCNDGFVGNHNGSATACYPAEVENGVCEDTPSGIVCQCDEGFEQPRNTIGCSPIFYECSDLTCGENAICRMYSAGARCECATNYEGDGYTCTPIAQDPTCDDLTCGANAICRSYAAGPRCECAANYQGDGYTCTRLPTDPTCDDLTCSPNATCRTYAAGPRCECKTHYEGDGYVCTPEPGYSECNPLCGAFASCGSDKRCSCDEGYFGNGYNCYPETTVGGTCTQQNGAITCDCNPGYHQARPESTACTDINECELPDQNGCEAWCTNTEGSFICHSTVADENSPYWENSCDPNDSRHQPQTELFADCRCGGNMTPDNDSPMGMCWRPITAGTGMAQPYRYGTGPSVADITALTPQFHTMVMHQASRKIYLGMSYTWAPFGIGAAYTGAVIEIDADTGNRRIVAGFWPDEFGGTHHPANLDMMQMTGLTHLPLVHNMVIGPDGETLFLTVQDHYSNAQVIRLNRTTGAMQLMWAEHLVIPIETRHNRSQHAQCWNGERVSGRKFVQINNRGFAMDANGNYLMTVVANSAADWISPVGIVRISADGSSCEWVRRTGAGRYNAYYDGTPSGQVGVGSTPIDVDCDNVPDTANGFLQLDAKFYAPVAPCGTGYFTGGNKGSGAAPQPGSAFRALHWVGGRLWAFDNNSSNLYDIDTQNASGWRVRMIGDDLAEDWAVEDTARDVVWLAGTGDGNNLGAFHFDEDPAQRWWQRVSPNCGAMPGPFPCLRGAMSTKATTHQPVVLDQAKGHLIHTHMPGIVRIEPETGNNVTFSL